MSATIENARVLATQMTGPVTTEADPLLRMLYRIPLFTAPLRNINGGVIASVHLMQKTKHASNALLDTAKPLPVIGMTLGSVDIIRIPMIYLTAFYLGEKIPFTLPNNAKWFYAALGLSLGLTAILFPFTAPIISITLASMALAANVVILKSVWDKYAQEKADIRDPSALKDQITTAKQHMADLQKRAEEQLSHLNNPPLENEESTIRQINALKAEYDSQKEILRKLNDRHLSLAENKSAQGKLLDRSVFTSLSAIMLTGAIISLLAVPAAPFLFIAGGLADTAYLIGRTAVNWLFPPKKPPHLNANAPPLTNIRHSTHDIKMGLGKAPQATVTDVAPQSEPTHTTLPVTEEQIDEQDEQIENPSISPKKL